MTKIFFCDKAGDKIIKASTMKPEILITGQGRKIAYHQTKGKGAGIVFLGGFSSDMEGSKAIYLENWAKENGRPFIRFDYSGHGQSSEKFIDGSIGDWAEDAFEIISHLTSEPQILVGSSMGGWIAFLMAKRIPNHILGIIGIAAAPDFTEDIIWNKMDDMMRATLTRSKVVYIQNDYGEPYPITKKLIDDGRNNLVMRDLLEIPFPVRLFHGSADQDVKIDVSLDLIDHINGSDVELTVVKNADHRFSSEKCLELICNSISSIISQKI